MRLVLQRVYDAAVTINGGETRSVGSGLMVLVGVCSSDTEKESAFLAEKMVNLRIFSDEDDNMNLSLLDNGGECMLISNFTLYANSKKGRRPSFIEAAPPDAANALYRHFVERVRALGVKKVETGEFGAHMDIAMTCNGPVTILLDSEQVMPKGRP